MNYLIDLILKLGTVDRRWIFLIIGTVVIIPLFFPLGLPIRATATTQQVGRVARALVAGTSSCAMPGTAVTAAPARGRLGGR